MSLRAASAVGKVVSPGWIALETSQQMVNVISVLGQRQALSQHWNNAPPTSRADRARFQWVMTFYLLALPAANKRYRTFLRHRFACSLFLLESNEHECGLKTALLCNVIDIILSEALTFIMRCLGTVIIVKKNAGMFFKYCETRRIHYSWGAGIAWNSNQAVHPFLAELPYLNLHLREVVSRYRDPQLHVSENYS